MATGYAQEVAAWVSLPVALPLPGMDVASEATPPGHSHKSGGLEGAELKLEREYRLHLAPKENWEKDGDPHFRRLWAGLFLSPGGSVSVLLCKRLRLAGIVYVSLPGIYQTLKNHAFVSSLREEWSQLRIVKSSGGSPFTLDARIY